uniref:phage tail tape measure protein n=1 Tax=uncultured Aeromicrobium sp. TaxID=337820 RepID=UPI0025D84B0E
MASERVVKVTIAANVADYKKKLEEAAVATRSLGSESEKLAQAKQSFEQVGRAGVAMGALLTAAIGVAVARFADFDEAMSAVQAATHESAANMSLLRDAALDAGASTVFSATEAAGAIEELSKAGVSTADILSGGLSASLDLAAAGGLDVADAAGIAATSLKVFNLSGKDMSHVADLLAAGAGKAMGDVSDLSQALAQGGQVAAATGLSIEETTATLAAFASQGLLGSDAGTSFKTMLQRLTPQ